MQEKGLVHPTGIEKFFQNLVERLPIAIGVHAHGKLLYANEYGLKLLGGTAESLIGCDILDLVHPDYHEKVKERIAAVMGGDTVPPIEEKYIRQDGKIIDVETSAFPFYYQGQNTVQVVIRDISERKMAEMAVRKSEALFTQLFENSPFAVVMLDGRGDVVKINKGFEETFGFEMEEVKNKGLNQFIVPQELTEQGNDLNSLISNYQVIKIETKRLHKSGKLVSVILYGIPVHMEDETIGIFGVYVDITDQKLIEEELKVRNAELDNFVYKVSHDLRAPLSSILGLVNLANLPGNDDSSMEYLKIVGKKATQLDHFISDVLSHSKNLKMDVTVSPVNFEEIIEKSFAELSYLNGIDQIEKSVEIEGGNFYSDGWRIQEVFRNLISNAIKYKDQDKPVSKIGISIIINAQSARIEVTDNGIGIEEDCLPRIFDMFYRASEQSDGSGLGLYIVRNAIEKLNGQIDITSKPNEGTSFLIQIPNKAETTII
jgi:PAS domain S-box-containing protein